MNGSWRTSRIEVSPDARGALRSLLRSPGFTVLAAVTLGLGVGFVGTALALLQEVVLEPLPVVDESALVVAWGDHRTRAFEHFPYSYQVWQLVGDGAGGLDGVAATEALGARERLVEDGDRLTPMR